MTRSKKFTYFFAVGIASIAFVYASAIHLFLKKAPYSASVSAILGALFLSFAIWQRLYEKRGKKYVSGVILGALSGSIVLLLGPIGFYAGMALEEPNPLTLSNILFALAMGGIAFPLVFLAMHGWAVVLASVFLGAILESAEHKSVEQKD